jgi:hypothetical protein
MSHVQQNGKTNKFEASMATLDIQLATRPARVIRTIDAEQLMARVRRNREDWIMTGANLTRQHVTVQQMFEEIAGILEDLGLEDATNQIVGVNHA